MARQFLVTDGASELLRKKADELGVDAGAVVRLAENLSRKYLGESVYTIPLSADEAAKLTTDVDFNTENIRETGRILREERNERHHHFIES